jgi:hypothetical protein
MGITLLNAPDRARTYPNMNAVLGIRAMHRVGGPGLALPIGKAVPIGTVPGNAFIRSAILYVSQLYNVAGSTLDIGGVIAGNAPPTSGAFPFPITTAAVLTAVANLPQTLTFGYVGVDDMEIYARLNGAGAQATGAFDYVLQFYTNQT